MAYLPNCQGESRHHNFPHSYHSPQIKPLSCENKETGEENQVRKTKRTGQENLFNQKAYPLQLS